MTRLNSSGIVDPARRVYLRRACDDALLEGIRAGGACLVLASRQVGKSSLLHHTALALGGERYACRIDLAGLIGARDGLYAWCDVFAAAVVKALNVPTRDRAWWSEARERTGSDAVETLFAAFDGVRCGAERPVVVMVDEVRTLLELPFRRDLVGLLGTLRERCASTGGAEVSFVFAGVASVDELAADVPSHPFTGRVVTVADFTLDEALRGFVGALDGPEDARAAVVRAAWERTSGHPAMTQALLIEAGSPVDGAAEAGVQAAFDRLYESRGSVFGALLADAEKLFVQEAAEEGRRGALERLDLYEAVRAAHPEAVPVDTRSRGRAEALETLRIAGVLTVEPRGGVVHARTRNEVFARRFDGAWVVSQRPRDEVAEKVRAFQKGVAAVALLPDEEAVVRFERAAGGDEALSDRERALTAAARQAHRAGRAREARLLRAWVATLAVAAVAAVAAGVWLRGKNRELLEGRVRAELDAAHRRANDHEVREAVRAAVEATRAWLEAGRRLDEFDARVAEDLVAVAVADRLAGEVVLRAPDGPPTGATLSRDGRTLRYATGRRVFQAEAPRYEPRVAATYGERVVQMVSDPSGGTSWVMLADGTRHALGGPRDRQAIAVPATLPNPSWHSRRFLLPRGGLLHCEGAAYVYAPVEGAPRPLAACGPELTQSTVEGSADENYVAASWAGGVDGERPSRALWSLRDGRCFHSASLPEAERVAVTPDGAFAIFTHAPAQGAVRSAVVDLRSGAEFPLKASQPTCALPEPFNIQMDSLIVEPTTGRMLAQDRGGLVWTELRPDGRSSPAPGPPTLGGGGFAASEDGHLVGTLRRGVLHPWSLGEGDARTPLSYLTPGGLRTHLLLDASWSRSVLTGDDGILHLRRSDMLRDARIISFAPSDSSPCEPHFVDQNTLWVDGRSALRLGMRRSGTTFQEVNAPERCEATSGHSSPSSVLTASELGEVTIKRRDGSAGILMSSNAVGGDVLLLGRDFYAAVAEGVPTLIDAASSRPLFASPAPTPRHYALSPDERSLATARPDGTRTRLSLWRRAGPAFQHLHGWWVDEDVQALAFREGDRAVVTVSVDRWLSVYEARNGTRARRVRLPLDGEVYAMTTHGSLVALETRDSVLLFGIARDIVRVQLPGSLGERPGRASLHFSPDGRMLLAGTLQRSGAYVLLLPTRLDDALASLCQGLRWREAPRGEAADLIAWCARHDPTARGGDLVW